MIRLVNTVADWLRCRDPRPSKSIDRDMAACVLTGKTRLVVAAGSRRTSSAAAFRRSPPTCWGTTASGVRWTS